VSALTANRCCAVAGRPANVDAMVELFYAGNCEALVLMDGIHEGLLYMNNGVINWIVESKKCY